MSALLTCMTEFSPHRLRDQADQSIRESVRKNDPIDANPETVVNTGECDRLSQKGEIPNDRFGGSKSDSG